MHIRFCFARCALGQVFTMLQTQAGDVRHVGLAAQGFKHCVWDSAGGWGGKWVVLPCYFYVYCIVFFSVPNCSSTFHVHLPEPKSKCHAQINMSMSYNLQY